jgi:hypothetical protein
MQRVVPKFIPRLLTQDQRDSRTVICQELLVRASEDENFLKRIIIGGETWVYGCDVETKMHTSQWVGKNSSRSKKDWWVRSNVKVMLTVSFDIKGVVHREYLRQGQTVNRWYYLEVLKRLREEKDPSCGETTPGFSIMTMHRLMHRYCFVTFWPTRTQLCFLSHPTHLTRLRQTFSFSPN